MSNFSDAARAVQLGAIAVLLLVIVFQLSAIYDRLAAILGRL